MDQLIPPLTQIKKKKKTIHLAGNVKERKGDWESACEYFDLNDHVHNQEWITLNIIWQRLLCIPMHIQAEFYAWVACGRLAQQFLLIAVAQCHIRRADYIIANLVGKASRLTKNAKERWLSFFLPFLDIWLWIWLKMVMDHSTCFKPFWNTLYSTISR